MIQITNKEKLNETLDQYTKDHSLNITLLTQSVSFQEHILCNVDNDVFEIYEIFSACMLNLHLLAMQTDDFELANKVQQAHFAQSKIMQDDCVIGDDDLTIAWRFYADEFFTKTIQEQLQQYSPKK